MDCHPDISRASAFGSQAEDKRNDEWRQEVMSQILPQQDKGKHNNLDSSTKIFAFLYQETILDIVLNYILIKMPSTQIVFTTDTTLKQQTLAKLKQE